MALTDLAENLSDKVTKQLNQLLREHERIHWIGAPKPHLSNWKNWMPWPLGIAWMAAVGYFVLWGPKAPMQDMNTPTRIVFALIASPLIIGGLALLQYPFKLRKEVENTLYIVTNQRAILFHSEFKKHNESFIAEDLKNIEVQKHKQGGHLIFDYAKPILRGEASKSVAREEEQLKNHPIGFLHLPDLAPAQNAIDTLVNT